MLQKSSSSVSFLVTLLKLNSIIKYKENKGDFPEFQCLSILKAQINHAFCLRLEPIRAAMGTGLDKAPVRPDNQIT